MRLPIRRWKKTLSALGFQVLETSEKQRRRRRTAQRAHQPRFEPLEPRQLLTTTVIDDGDVGFAETNFDYLPNPSNPGFETDWHRNKANDGAGEASWTFSGLSSGDYLVSATWRHDGSLARASDAPYTFEDGVGTQLATATGNQTLAPDDRTESGADWEDLTTVTVTGDTLVVKLNESPGATGQVIADAVRIERLGGELNNPPVFVDQTMSVAENSADGTLVGTLTATDADDDSLTYSIATNVDPDGDGNEAFRIEGDQLLVNDADDFDYETNPQLVITAEASDGSLSDGATITVDLTAVNEAPVISLPGAQSVDQDGSLVFSNANGNPFSLADVDAPTSNVGMRIESLFGYFTLPTTTGLVFYFGSENGESSITFIGKLSAINTALDGLVYEPFAGYSGADFISVTSHDLGNSGAGGAQISYATLDVTVNPVADTNVIILDNGDDGFTQSGFTYLSNSLAASAYDGDNHNMRGGEGTATWTFDNLEEGEYRVAATWAHKYGNRYNAPDAPFTLRDGETQRSQVLVDQQNVPAEFTDQEVSWDTLDTITVTSGTLRVELSEAPGNNYVVADAIRIERIGDVSRGLSVVIADDSVSEADGAAATTATVTRSGATSGDLVVSLASDDVSEAAVPSSVTILDGQSSASFEIAAVDDSDADGTQTVTVTASATGFTSGTDSVDVTDDEVATVFILDNGDDGFTQSGFTYLSNSLAASAYDGDNHNMRGGEGTATWTFDGLESGEYEVAATWAHKYGNRYNAPDAPFTLRDGETQRSQVLVDQKNSPAEFTDAEGTTWDTLDTITVTSGTLRVELSEAPGNNYVVADAIRIERIAGSPPTATDDTYAVNEDNVLSGNVITDDTGNGLDTDPDGGGLSIVASSTVDPQHGLLSLNSDGSFSYTPAAEFAGIDSFEYEISDSYGLTATATVTINVVAINDAPSITIPASQVTNPFTPLIFSTTNGNAISVSDLDLGSNSMELSLSSINGTLTLATTTNLSFTQGDGLRNDAMTFVGTAADINTALEGLTFDPDPAFAGTASFEIAANDLGNTGGGGPQSDLVTIEISVDPASSIDLKVDQLAISPTAPESSDTVTISWDSHNFGNASINHDFYDHLVVVHTNTGTTIVDKLLYYDFSLLGELPAGQSHSQSYTFVLPDGSAGVGEIDITVTTDRFDSIAESNNLNSGESNNNTLLTFTSTLANYGDLQATNLEIPQSVVESGQEVTVTWQLLNSSSIAIDQAFSEQLTVVNRTSDETLVDAIILFVPEIDGGPIAPNGSRARQFTFTLPDGTAGAGELDITITADSSNVIYENSNDENNTTTLSYTATLADYADLVVNDITTSSTTVTPGEQIDIIWKVTNQGTKDVTGTWNEQIFLSRDSTHGSDQLIETLSHTGTIAAGDTINRSHQWTVPIYELGDRWIIVGSDSSNEIFELDESNNAATIGAPITIAAGLALALSTNSASEAAGASSVLGTLTRNDTSNDIEIEVFSSDETAATVPATVNMAAGISSVVFPIAMIDESTVDGTQSVVISASAPNFTGADATLAVTDNESPQIDLSLSLNSVAEGSGTAATTLTVSHNTPGSDEVIVSLTTNSPTYISIPASVTIPSNQTSVEVQIDVAENDIIDATHPARITAAADGYDMGTTTLAITDNDIPQLAIALDDTSISETAGYVATWGTVTSSLVLPLNQFIQITTNSSLVTAYPFVVIPAGESTAHFLISANNNSTAQGDQSVTITATAMNSMGSMVIESTQTEAILLVTDDEGPSLTVQLDSSVLSESGAVTGTVTRNTGTSGVLNVTLNSSDAGEATVPANITIEDGLDSASFTVSGVLDELPDGTAPVTVIASADGFNSGQSTLSVSDVDLPDLRVQSVTFPAFANTGSTATLSWTVVNTGADLANGTWVDQVWLTGDALNDGDVLITEIAATHNLAVSDSYSNSADIVLPDNVGTIRGYIVTGVDSTVVDASQGNNTGYSNIVHLEAAYHATVDVDLTVAPSGTPAIISGQAIDNTSGTPVPNAVVEVGIEVNGFHRSRFATTDENGEYSLTFNSLATEAGFYTVTANFPNVAGGQSDTFMLLGMKAAPPTDTARLTPSVPQTRQVEIFNRNNVDITGLSYQIIGDVPSWLNLEVVLPDTLPGDGSITLEYTLNATLDQFANGGFGIQINSADSSALTIPINISVVPQTANWEITPGSLASGMIRGERTLVHFGITNNGGITSDPVKVLLPDATDWMTLLTPNPLPPLAPDESATVILALDPDITLPLGNYAANLVISDGLTSATVACDFLAVSDAVVDVQIQVEDELTYFSEGQPYVENATVTIRNPFTHQIVASAVTDSEGLVQFPELPEGQYEIEAYAADHFDSRSAIIVTAGTPVNTSLFLQREFVTTHWVVEPAEIADEYIVSLESTFQTNVPVPVVTIDNQFLIPVLFEGEWSEFEIVMTNHGLIAAQGAEITTSDSDDYIIELLVDEIGSIPAQTTITVPVRMMAKPGTMERNAEMVQADQLQRNGIYAAEPDALVDLNAMFSALRPPITDDSEWDVVVQKLTNRFEGRDDIDGVTQQEIVQALRETRDRLELLGQPQSYQRLLGFELLQAMGYGVGSLVGTLSDSATGHGIGNAVIQATLLDDQGQPTGSEVSVVTDDEGTFTIYNRKQGTYRVQVSGESTFVTGTITDSSDATELALEGDGGQFEGSDTVELSVDESLIPNGHSHAIATQSDFYYGDDCAPNHIRDGTDLSYFAYYDTKKENGDFETEYQDIPNGPCPECPEKPSNGRPPQIDLTKIGDGSLEVVDSFDDSTGFQAIILQDGDGNIFVTCRGTAGIDDAYADAGLGRNQWINNRGAIFEKIMALRGDTGAQVNFYGHSLGGGLAEYLAYDAIVHFGIESDKVTLFTVNGLGALAGLALQDKYQQENAPGADYYISNWKYEPSKFDVLFAKLKSDNIAVRGDLISRVSKHLSGPLNVYGDYTQDWLTAHGKVRHHINNGIFCQEVDELDEDKYLSQESLVNTVDALWKIISKDDPLSEKSQPMELLYRLVAGIFSLPNIDNDVADELYDLLIDDLQEQYSSDPCPDTFMDLVWKGVLPLLSSLDGSDILDELGELGNDGKGTNEQVVAWAMQKALQTQEEGNTDVPLSTAIEDAISDDILPFLRGKYCPKTPVFDTSYYYICGADFRWHTVSIPAIYPFWYTAEEVQEMRDDGRIGPDEVPGTLFDVPRALKDHIFGPKIKQFFACGDALLSVLSHATWETIDKAYRDNLGEVDNLILRSSPVFQIPEMLAPDLSDALQSVIDCLCTFDFDSLFDSEDEPCPTDPPVLPLKPRSGDPPPEPPSGYEPPEWNLWDFTKGYKEPRLRDPKPLPPFRPECLPGMIVPAQANAGYIHTSDVDPDAGVCAEVVMHIEQRAALTRSAFVGSLEITNASEDTNISNVTLNIEIYDAAGKLANDLFGIASSEWGGFVSGNLSAGATGILRTTFVPTQEAAADRTTDYTIGGTLSFTEGGADFTLSIEDTTITVYPDAALDVKYFQQREVYSDDPHTSEVEPTEPFSLGIMVTNSGNGSAKNFSIISSQPTIIDNEKGLLLDMQIIGAQVGSEVVAPSLRVNFGNIDPDTTAVARWLMTSTVQGSFVDYDASFIHVDDFGDVRTSLIDSVNVYELIHAQNIDVATVADDGQFDFLTNDIPDESDLPDTLHLSDGSVHSVAHARNVEIDGLATFDNLELVLTADVEGGWNYLSTLDPGPQFILSQVLRSDDSVVPMDSHVWRTDRTFPTSTSQVTRENRIHLLDHDAAGEMGGTATYTLIFSKMDEVAPFVSAITTVLPDPRTDPVESLYVTFSEELYDNSFDHTDISLNRDSVALDLGESISVEKISASTFRVSGLTGLTDAPGQYEFIVSGSGVADTWGNSGINSLTESWTVVDPIPVILQLGPVDPAVRNLGIPTIDVVFSESIASNSFDLDDISLARDNSSNLIDTGVTITALSPSTYRIGGLSAITAAEGQYTFSIDAAGVTNDLGYTGSGNASVDWNNDTTAPIILTLSGVDAQRQSEPVTSIDIEFSEPIVSATFSKAALTFLKDSTTISIDNNVSIQQISGSKYRIAGIDGLQTGNGNYQLAVDAGEIQDLAGNYGFGLQSASWIIDSTPPTAPTNLTISPDRGVSDHDGVTNTSSFVLTGDLNESGLTVVLFDETRDADLGMANVTADGFSINLNFDVTGTHRIRVNAIDESSNISADAYLDIFIDVANPVVTTVTGIDAEILIDAVNEIEIHFSEKIASSSFSKSAISLTRNNGPDLIADSEGVIVASVTEDTYRISGLGDLTEELGDYVVKIQLTEVLDLAGNSGNTSFSKSWSKVAPVGTIGDLVWHDMDGDGIQDAGEEGLAGVTVRLLDYSNNSDPLATVVTDASGAYLFEDINITGEYLLEVVAPTDYHFSPQDQSSSYSDSDVDPMTGQTNPFSPLLGNNLNWDAGLFQHGQLNGVVWEDANRDTVYGMTETPLAGWTVYIDQNTDGQFDTAEPSTVTDESGNFSFAGLQPGTYILGEVLPPDLGWEQTTPGISGAYASAAYHTATFSTAENTEIFMPGTPVDVDEFSAAHSLISLDSLWSDNRFADLDGSGQAAVIIDSGIDLDHPFFGADLNADGVADRIVYHYDFADRDADASDVTGHGSHVSSIIGSSDSEYPGVAPGADLIHLKVFGDNGRGYFSHVEQALQWTIAHVDEYNIATVNLSVGDNLNWSSSVGQYSISDEIATLAQANVLVVASSGNRFAQNSSEPGLAYPAADPNTVSVGAVWDSDRGTHNNHESSADGHHSSGFS